MPIDNEFNAAGRFNVTYATWLRTSHSISVVLMAIYSLRCVEFTHTAMVRAMSCTPHAGHAFFHTGLRFSKKAFTPSR
jgi:hypothetical protein